MGRWSAAQREKFQETVGRKKRTSAPDQVADVQQFPKDNKIEIRHQIVLNINGHEIILSQQQANELHEELSRAIFPSANSQ